MTRRLAMVSDTDGRVTVEPIRNERMIFRCSAEERAETVATAKRCGMQISEFVRYAIGLAKEANPPKPRKVKKS